MIFVNFKTYEQGTGGNAIELTRKLEKVASEKEFKVIPVVQASDILEIVQITKLQVWTQLIDPVEYGAHTGSILPEAVKEDGAVGTFLNHSEHKFEDFEKLSKAVQRCKEVGLETLIFAGGIDELEKVVTLKPTFVSYEPPELVGSKTTSVSQEKPEVIKKAVVVARESDLPLIVGAGIKSEEDVRISVQLGAVGVAVASDIVKAEDPEKELEELIKGFE
ncbi:triosephosphate isomerase [Candidatus Woesebacteria bacterium]|nr:triosephosphate isomerase [Candidatus Woesebacteria bacterium]